MTALIPKSAVKERPPIVVVMGHVDHGKTTLLDTIRREKTSAEKRIKATVDKEAGGITQHIGAYEVIHANKRITFIDTPGHEAFSAMRSRGTSVADVALLIIAADDGVKPQTKEALKHIQEAEIPFIVVLAKMDKPNAQPEKVKNGLAEIGVLVEGRGGQVPVVEISAKDGQGIEDLLDTITLVAELEELKYDAIVPVEGYVLESHRDPKRGITTKVVLTNGTLRVGDFIVCGPTYGKIKIMEDYEGKRIKGAIPSSPVQIIGLYGISVAGDPCKVVFLEKDAKEEIKKYEQLLKERQEELKLEPENQENVLPVLLKTDCQGSLEALVNFLRQIKSEKVGLAILKTGVGNIIEEDIKFSEASGTKIFGFGVKVAKEAQNYAEQKRIKIACFDVIYELIEAVREEMSRLLEPEIEKKILGEFKVLAIFRTEANRMIVGGKVNSGKFVRGAKIEILRNEEKIGEGKIVGLQQNQQAKEEILKGSESGVLFEGKIRIKEGDILMTFKEEKTYPEL